LKFSPSTAIPDAARFNALAGLLIAAAALTALVVPACSLYQQHKESQPDNIRTKETFLADAGFKKIPIDNAHRGQMAMLPAYELRFYDAAMGRVYWYYDPAVCQCIYVGDDYAYDGYVLAARQQEDIATYVAESEDADAASLYAFNGSMFPPPLFLFGGGLLAGGFEGGVPGIGGGTRHGGHSGVSHSGGGSSGRGGFFGGGHHGGGFFGGGHDGSHGGHSGGHGH
jgi:hypothetical protein